jgi:hypothetical protein
VEEGACPKAAWRAAKQLRDAIHAANSALCESIRAADGTVAESAGITTVFREHYKQLGSPLVCAEFDADNFDRVLKVQDWVASQSTKRNAKYDEPFTKKEMERVPDHRRQSWRRC